MNRRLFLQSIPLLGAGLVSCSTSRSRSHGKAAVRGSLSFDNPSVRCFSPAIEKPVRLLLIPDTHLWRDDFRGEDFMRYSARMSKAYNSTRHFQTAAPTDPEQSFVAALKLAGQRNADLVVLAGDLFSFPSEAAIEWAQARLQDAALPYAYVAGNHDWHYEGMDGTSDLLRETWIQKRLRPLYQGVHPMMSVRKVGGLRVILLDNSTYEIHPEQLEFYRRQVKTGEPIALIVHIPLYVPGRSVGFGCGHPDWGGKNDKSFELERRPRWRETGHTETTLAFHREVFSTPNLLGVFAGHIHRPSSDAYLGVPQIVSDANAVGAYLDIEFLPGSYAG
ncbi:MAG: metallophosphoesterase [Verrucomicrobia bacterium]|nr:metallophosphoesterase [Verrucomicrobiota bacterium]